MTLAYLISAHTDAPQLKRLVETLHPDAHFFIHIDKKSDITPFQALLPQDNVQYKQKHNEESKRKKIKKPAVRVYDRLVSALKRY